MESNLNILETKVIEAVKLIKELRVERDRLQGRVAELEAQTTDLESQNGRLNHELDEARSNAVNVEVYEEKRKEIEVKVGGLLEQLEALG